MENNNYDVAIIGTGPAGVSAALTLQARGRNFIMFGIDPSQTERLSKAHQINNYPGLVGSGLDLALAFKKQLQDAEITWSEKRISNIFPMGKKFGLIAGQEEYYATTVIVATGADFGKPLQGESKFLGRGVSYCATCDGMLYRSKTVIAISYAKSEEREVEFLSTICEKVLFLPQYKTQTQFASNVEIINDSPNEITGENKATTLITKLGTSLTGECIFILRETISPATLIPGLVTENGSVKVERDMSTNFPGCFAAGDITGQPLQIAKAVGEGNIAALSADKYISSLQSV